MSVADTIHIIEGLRNDISQYLPLSLEQVTILNKKFTLELLYNNKHSEGKTLTYIEEEIEEILNIEIMNDADRELKEMKASEVGYKYTNEYSNGQYDLTEAFIKELNGILLVQPYYGDAITLDGKPTRKLISIGTYKTQPNNVKLENGDTFYYSSPLDVPVQMYDLVKWYNSDGKKLHPVVLAAGLHHRFVRIHPFDDGNGRVSRLLMNYVFMNNNLPPVIIKTIEKLEYLNALHHADNGDIEVFVNHIGNQLIQSLELTIQFLKGRDIEEFDDWQKKLSLIDKGYNLISNITSYGSTR